MLRHRRESSFNKFGQEVSAMRRKAAASKIQILPVFGSFALFNPFLHAEDYIFNSAGVRIHYTVEGNGGAGGCPLF